MDTFLQNTSLVEDEVTKPTPAESEVEHAEGEEGHAHSPVPSFWPIILAVGIFVAIIGFLFINQAAWIIVVSIPLILIGILGWGLEDPTAISEQEKTLAGRYATTYAQAEATGKPTALAEMVLEEAEEVVDKKVTVSSTAWSAHPVKVFIEREGVVLSLYGKVELEEQKKEVEDALRQLPGVIDVMNFLVAEDELLNQVNALIARLQAAGKLEGAKNLSALVENYIVSLYGEVPNPEMKYMLEKEITAIPGARVVINHIGLNTDIPGNLGKTTNRIARI